MDMSAIDGMAENEIFRQIAFIFAIALVLFAWTGHLRGMIE